MTIKVNFQDRQDPNKRRKHNQKRGKLRKPERRQSASQLLHAAMKNNP